MSSHPFPQDRFVGRAAELARIRALLDSGTRIVTLVGPGGMGKTRAALEILRNYPHPAWLVDLTACVTEADLLQALFSSLATSLCQARTTEDAYAVIAATLPLDGPALLMLDNAEQAVADVTRLIGRLLAKVDTLRVLVTSRTRLDHCAQVCVPLEPLAERDAIELYRDRARAVGAADAEPAEISELVIGALEGMPLAIELAAARAAVMPPRELAKRWGDRLEGASVGAKPERHRSLLRSLDWSWELLPPAGRDVLTQCSVFEGGIGLEAAEAVIELGPHSEELDLLDVFMDLQRHSMVRVRNVDGNTRIFMLESVHRYAHRKLLASDQKSEPAKRHRRYFAEQAWVKASWNGQMVAPATMEWIAREHANLMVVVRDQEADREAVAMAALAVALLGPFEDSIRTLGTALVAGSSNGAHRSALLTRRASLLSKVGRFDEARTDLDAVIDAGEPRMASIAATLKSAVLRQQGDYGTALDIAARAEALAKLADDPVLEIEARAALGSCHMRARDFDAAARIFDATLARMRTHGGPEHRADLLVGQLWLAHAAGDSGRAELYCAQLAGVIDVLAPCPLRDGATAAVAYHHVSTGDPARGRALLRRVLDHVHVMTSQFNQIGYRLAYATACWLSGDIDDALDTSETARREAMRMGHRNLTALTYAVSGAVLASSDRIDQARRAFADAETMLRGAGAMHQGATQLLEAYLDLALFRREANADAAAAEHHLRRAEQRLDEADAYTWDARFHITRLREQIAAARATSHTASLVVGPEARWFRALGADPIDLSRKSAMRRILHLLVQTRLGAPGRPSTMADLFAAGWPNERISHQSATHRVHVTINRLRTAGLAHVLIRWDDGYVIDPAVEVVERS